MGQEQHAHRLLNGRVSRSCRGRLPICVRRAYSLREHDAFGLHQIETPPPVQSPLGILRRLAAKTGLLGRRNCDRRDQRRLRRSCRLGPTRLPPADGFRAVELSASPAPHTCGFRPLCLARHPLLPQCARQRHPAGHRCKASAWRGRALAPAVAPACLREDPAYGPRALRRGIDRSRRPYRPGRRLDHAAGRPLGRNGSRARAHTCRFRRGDRGRIQHTAGGHRIRDRGNEPDLRVSRKRTRSDRSHIVWPRGPEPLRQLHLFRHQLDDGERRQRFPAHSRLRNRRRASWRRL